MSFVISIQKELEKVIFDNQHNVIMFFSFSIAKKADLVYNVSINWSFGEQIAYDAHLTS